MSLEQYKDKTRQELLLIMDIQAEEYQRLLDESGRRIAELKKERDDLRDEQLPNEQGTNRYGLDVAYFRKTINRELNRDLRNFMPSELARVLARLSVTADKQVIHEPEFSEAHNLEQQAKGLPPNQEQ